VWRVTGEAEIRARRSRNPHAPIGIETREDAFMLLGYKLMSEEHGQLDLVQSARRAVQAERRSLLYLVGQC
jgi:hypothetical protein